MTHPALLHFLCPEFCFSSIYNGLCLVHVLLIIKLRFSIGKVSPVHLQAEGGYTGKKSQYGQDEKQE